MTEKLMYTSREGIHYDTALEAAEADEREKCQRFITALGFWQNDIRDADGRLTKPLPSLEALTARLANIHGEIMEYFAPKKSPPPGSRPGDIHAHDVPRGGA